MFLYKKSEFFCSFVYLHGFREKTNLFFFFFFVSFPVTSSTSPPAVSVAVTVFAEPVVIHTLALCNTHPQVVVNAGEMTNPVVAFSDDVWKSVSADAVLVTDTNGVKYEGIHPMTAFDLAEVIFS